MLFASCTVARLPVNMAEHWTWPEHSLQDQWIPVWRRKKLNSTQSVDWRFMQWTTADLVTVVTSEELLTLRINLLSKIWQCAYIHSAPGSNILAGAPCILDNRHCNGAEVKASAAGWGFAGEGNKYFSLHLKREDEYMWPLGVLLVNKLLMVKCSQ